MNRTRPRQFLLAAVLSALLAAAMATAELVPCDDQNLGERARCGTVSVLEDRSRPEGRRIDLNVVVLGAERPAGLEPVFMLAGGPGQGATDLAGLALRPFASVNETRDFVLVDQRGTGDSNPLLCLNDSAARPQEAFGGLFKPDAMAACLEDFASRADPALYSTPHVIVDLEEVREQLGYERVVLWGGSGGTRTALVWMREHPDRIAAALIDGIVPTDFRAPSGMARAAHRSLERVVDDCAAQESCAEAFPDVEADFRRVLWLFEGGPVKTRIEREDGSEVAVEMTRGDFAYAMRGMLYQSRRIAQLPKVLHEAAASGDMSPFAQALWARDVALRPVVAMGVHFGVYCAEDLPFIESDRVAELTDGTFFGRYLIEQYGAVCDLWGIEPLDRDFLAPTKVDVPTLIYSGYYDPSTPPELGESVAHHLPNSRHVVVRNESHGSQFGCGRQAAIDFLTHASLEGLGPICEDVGPVEFVVE